MIKNIKMVLVFLIGFSSCQSFQGLPGYYIKKTKDYRYSLKVQTDSSFVFERESNHSHSNCKGIWKVRGDTLILKCHEEPLQIQLSSGYWNDREMEVLLLNDGKMKLGTITLTRTEK